MASIIDLNNPGAIEDGDFARSQPGYVGGGGRFAKFDSPQSGIAAQERLLSTSKNYRGQSISRIIQTYSPVSKENPAENVNNYINYVAQRTGIDPRKPVPSDKVSVVASAMREFETGKGKKPVSAADQNFIDSMGTAFGIPIQKYEVGAPTAGENANVAKGGNFPIANPGNVNTQRIKTLAGKVPGSSEDYAAYLDSATQALRENAAQVVDREQKIAGTKRNLVNDFANREADLESKIRPLMARKEALLAHLDSLEQLSPLDRRMKSIFNPEKYDPRMIRGQIERINAQIDGYSGDYDALNKLRAGVAAASIDAETADQNVLNVARQSTLSDLSLLGQVVGATKAAATDQLFPLSTQVETLKLTEATKDHLLGTLSLEKVTDLANKAAASPDGTIIVDGVKLTVGELQQTSKARQTQDLSFRSMVNSFKLGDMKTADEMETYTIDHMTPEQIAETLKNGGKYNGYQLSVSKLTAAADVAQRQRDQKLEGIVNSTTVGLSSNILKRIGEQQKFTGTRMQEMFGNLPTEYTSLLDSTSTQLQAWTKGLNDANAQGVGTEYVAKTMGVLTGIQAAQDKIVGELANKWGNGNKDLTAIADAYLRGNPLNSDSAVKGLISMARSGGVPSGAHLTGPAAQAFQIAKSVVSEWDNPQAGDSLETLLKGGSGSKKEADLQRLVQQRIGAAFADSLTDTVMNDLPQVARGVHDPNNPNRLHPFARVSREDFMQAIRYGDNQGISVVAQKMGVTPDQAKAIFSGGVDSPEWKTLAGKKGWTNGDFSEFYSALVANQMNETLAALDASHSAAPGFSPAKAFVDFMQQPEVIQKVNQAVQAYGQGSFGSFLVSNAAGGGFTDAWQNYTQTLASAYQVQHSKVLQNRIAEQRRITGDPWVRMNAVNQAAGLTPQESQALLAAIKPLVSLNQTTNSQALATGGLAGPIMQNRDVGNFNAISDVMRNHQLDDPKLEKLRKKVATQWDTIDALVGTVFNSVND